MATKRMTERKSPGDKEHKIGEQKYKKTLDP
jgi:hypothetical protein